MQRTHLSVAFVAAASLFRRAPFGSRCHSERSVPRFWFCAKRRDTKSRNLSSMSTEHGKPTSRAVRFVSGEGSVEYAFQLKWALGPGMSVPFSLCRDTPNCSSCRVSDGIRFEVLRLATSGRLSVASLDSDCRRNNSIRCVEQPTPAARVCLDSVSRLHPCRA